MAHLLVNLPGEKHMSTIIISALTKKCRAERINLHTAEKTLAPVDQMLDNAINWINLYPADKCIGLPNTYLLKSDLSSG